MTENSDYMRGTYGRHGVNVFYESIFSVSPNAHHTRTVDILIKNNRIQSTCITINKQSQTQIIFLINIIRDTEASIIIYKRFTKGYSWGVAAHSAYHMFSKCQFLFFPTSVFGVGISDCAFSSTGLGFSDCTFS